MLGDMYHVRPAKPDDADTIAQFNIAMALETEGKTLESAVIAAGVRRVLDRPEHGRYLVATDSAGSVVASLMITHEWSDWRNGQVWWIQSVYVHPGHRRRGVFKKLYHATRELGRQTPGVIGYRLYVERENLRAQATYRSLGMTQTPYLIYEDLDH